MYARSEMLKTLRSGLEIVLCLHGRLRTIETLRLTSLAKKSLLRKNLRVSTNPAKLNLSFRIWEGTLWDRTPGTHYSLGEIWTEEQQKNKNILQLKRKLWFYQGTGSWTLPRPFIATSFDEIVGSNGIWPPQNIPKLSLSFSNHWPSLPKLKAQWTPAQVDTNQG